jgi:hypothetical protein
LGVGLDEWDDEEWAAIGAMQAPMRRATCLTDMMVCFGRLFLACLDGLMGTKRYVIEEV